MKKKIAAIILIALIAVTCLGLAACKPASGKKSPAGIYELYSIKGDIFGDGNTATFIAGLPSEVNGIAITIQANAMSLTLYTDNTFVMQGDLLESTLKEEGTWTYENNELSMTIDDETEKVAFENGMITLSEGEMEIKFKFVKAITTTNPSNSSKIIGTYKFVSLEMVTGTASVKVEAGKKVTVEGKEILINENDWVAYINKDGSFVIKRTINNKTDNDNGSWSYENGVFSASQSYNVWPIALTDGTLTVSYDSYIVNFKFSTSSTEGGEYTDSYFWHKFYLESVIILESNGQQQTYGLGSEVMINYEVYDLTYISLWIEIYASNRFAIYGDIISRTYGDLNVNGYNATFVTDDDEQPVATYAAELKDGKLHFKVNDYVTAVLSTPNSD